MSRTPSPARLEVLSLVAIGGVVGSTLRYAVTLVAASPLVATLLVNVLGSFLLGLLLYEARYRGALPERLQLAVGTGVLSSFTTYSTFAHETYAVPELALVNVAATYGLGFAAVLAGRAVVRRTRGVT